VLNSAGRARKRWRDHVLRDYPENACRRLVLASGNYYGYMGVGRCVIAGYLIRRRVVYRWDPVWARMWTASILAGAHDCDDFGPDVEWIEKEDYNSIRNGQKVRFYASIRRYWRRELAGSIHCSPIYAGIRPKAHGSGSGRAGGPRRSTAPPFHDRRARADGLAGGWFANVRNESPRTSPRRSRSPRML